MGGFQSVGLSSKITEFKFCELNLKVTMEEQTRININLHSKLHEILWLRLKFSKFIKNLQNPKNTILRTWRTFVDEHKTRSWVPSCASWKYSQGSTKLNFGFWFRFRFTVDTPYYQRLKPPWTTGRWFWRVYTHDFIGAQGLTVRTRGWRVHVRTV